MYLADKFWQDKQAWNALKERLEGFGKEAGLFDEISIKQLSKRVSDPFQVQIRKFEGGMKGPQRNLIDVGYGVSQVLPVVTELLRGDAPDMFLLQQPEVHLHPSAQAALGSLFCQIASVDRQLVVETHSDHLMDRVRMVVRDGVSGLKHEDVSILFFEREGLDVRIHSLQIDEEGNIVGAPDSYAGSSWKRLKGHWGSSKEMCAIVDANVSAQVFEPGQQSPAGKKFLEWLTKRKGRLVVGGKLLEELERGSKGFKTWGVEALRAGKMRVVNASEIGAKTEELQREEGYRSDDPHILALAQVSGARLLYSNDSNLQQDFGNRKLIDNPRGKVYSTIRTTNFSLSHRRLLVGNDLCPAKG